MDIIPGLNSLYGYIWIIPLVSAIHEFEEWNILKWYRKHYRNMPGSTNTSIRIHIVTLSLLFFLLTFIAHLARETFLFSMIIVFMSCFILLNFLQHVIWTVQLKDYSTGLATAILNIAAVVFVNALLIRNNLVMLPFYLMLFLIASPLVKTVKAKGEMTDEVRRIHLFFIGVEKVLSGIIKSKESK